MTERLHFHFSLSCIGEGNGNPLQCSCLENPRDRGAWWVAVYGVSQSRTRLKRLSSSSSRLMQLLWRTVWSFFFKKKVICLIFNCDWFQASGSFSCTGTDSRYLRLRNQNGLCDRNTALPLMCLRQQVNDWTWLCSNKALFIREEPGWIGLQCVVICLPLNHVIDITDS